jgi:hypothetical protein
MGAANLVQAGHQVLGAAHEMGLLQVKAAVALGDNMLEILAERGQNMPIMDSDQTPSNV